MMNQKEIDEIAGALILRAKSCEDGHSLRRAAELFCDSGPGHALDRDLVFMCGALWGAENVRKPEDIH